MLLANQSQSSQPHLFPEDTPLIFIGGFPRSGTTLMRAMLDAHSAVRCGEETRVIPRLLAMRATWSRSVKERIRLDEAGVTDQVLDSAVRAFLLEVGPVATPVKIISEREWHREHTEPVAYHFLHHRWAQLFVMTLLLSKE